MVGGSIEVGRVRRKTQHKMLEMGKGGKNKAGNAIRRQIIRLSCATLRKLGFIQRVMENLRRHSSVVTRFNSPSVFRIEYNSTLTKTYQNF